MGWIIIAKNNKRSSLLRHFINACTDKLEFFEEKKLLVI
jgi:hypothetical protein